MEIAKRIEDIWNDEKLNEILPCEILERKWCFCGDVLKQNCRILIIGFNPSYRDEIKEIRPVSPFSFGHIMNTCRNHFVLPKGKWDSYWTPVSEIIWNGSVDLRNVTSYWDIFSFREKNQSCFKKKILTKEPSEFVIKHIQLTQKIIEILKPELIIVKNKEAWAYFGYYFGQNNFEDMKNVRWMNYKYKKMELLPCGSAQYELKKIVGIHKGYDLNAINGNDTCLRNTKVLFMPHINQYVKKENRPSPQMIANIIGY